ncbi:MAG: hypothetical protein Q8S10_12630 [Thiobacillus sp.]|nr:hypothetical protein [Thiobacillus sp.]
MKSGIRTLFAITAGVALLAAASSHWAGEQVSRDDKAAADARVATFMSYRLAQSLKALAAGHELTMNEFYSTVLEFPAYQKKSAAQKAVIEGELAALVDLQANDAAAAGELARLFKAMDRFRLDLEKAMTGDETDWDAAREALFKMNVLSVQAIQQADFLGQSANQRAAEADAGRQARQSQALLWLRVTTLLALFAGVLLVYGALRAKS